MAEFKEKDSEAVHSLSFTSEEELATAKEQGIDVVYLAKIRVINASLREAGFGKYQWLLFISSGFGWMADNLWLQAVALLQPFVAYEFFSSSDNDARLATLALYAGLIVGATFWGFLADVIGRRLAFNSTLFGGAVFGIAAGGTNSFAVYGVMLALLGFFVGGNLPIDGALFLEFVPESHQCLSLPFTQRYIHEADLLTLLSMFWAIGQVIGSLISWVFLANYSCPADDYFTAACNKSNNYGWRYSYFTMGSLMFALALIRMFVLPMQESPKYLVSVGKDAAAVAVIQKVAKMNGRQTTLTVEKLRGQVANMTGVTSDQSLDTKYSTLELLKKSGEVFRSDHVKRLFSNRKLAYSTSLIMLIYGILGLAYPLFNGFLGLYLTARNANFGNSSVSASYSTYTYQAACGVPGSMVASILVLGKFGGRRIAMAFFTILSGIFLFALTAVRTPAGINGLTSVAAFAEKYSQLIVINFLLIVHSAFYGILYAYAPEVFPSISRGTGDALASAASRVTGIFAPVIALYASKSNVEAPVYASAALFVLSGLLMLCLPFEPAKMRGGAL